MIVLYKDPKPQDACHIRVTYLEPCLSHVLLYRRMVCNTRLPRIHYCAALRYTDSVIKDRTGRLGSRSLVQVQTNEITIP